MRVGLMLTAGQWPFRMVNFMCDDLDSLTLIFHFFSHFSITCKWWWRLSEAIVGTSWLANIAVSSANVLNVVSLDAGKSDVYSTYRIVPRMIPWGTPEWMWKRLEFSILPFFHSFIYDVCYAMALLHCGEGLSECKLMVWCPVLPVQVVIDFFSISLSSTFKLPAVSCLIGRMKRPLDFLQVWVWLLFVQTLMI